MISSILNKIDAVVGIETVSAHCDIPCKIYDPSAAQVAALSVIRFTNLINDIKQKETLSVADHAQLSRLVSEKETHAAKVKDEIVVIWGDYFKQPQFEQFPNIGELVHKILMAGSACKQYIDEDKADTLLVLVNEFAEAFWTTKGVATFSAECPYPPSKTVVYPKLG